MGTWGTGLYQDDTAKEYVDVIDTNSLSHTIKISSKERIVNSYLLFSTFLPNLLIF